MSERQLKLEVCPYCGSHPALVTGRTIYPQHRKLWEKNFIHCKPCDAYVGCHDDPQGKIKPLGMLANKELRGARIRAHSLFDRMWKKGRMHRSSAYTWLASQLGIEKRHCHIGMFDLEMCNKVITVMEDHYGRTKIKTKADRQEGRAAERLELGT